MTPEEQKALCLECAEALTGLLDRFDPYAVPGTDKNLEAEQKARDVLKKLEEL